jgi:hypothetical protein
VEVVCQVREEPQTLLRGGGNEIDCGAGGPHEDARPGAAIFQQQFPFHLQPRCIVGGKPILVVQKNVV